VCIVEILQYCDDEVFDDNLPTGESQITSNHLHPVVFRWRGSGERVFLSGSYDNWQAKIPLVRRLVLIVFKYELNSSVMVKAYCLQMSCFRC
jgi:hypothetical protein